MPTESAPPPERPTNPSYPSQHEVIKCSLCGAGGFSSSSNTNRNTSGVVVLSEPIERICGSCVRAQENNAEWHSPDLDHPEPENTNVNVGLGLRDVQLQDVFATSFTEAIAIPTTPTISQPPRSFQVQSLPTQHTRPWTTANVNQTQAPVSPVLEIRTPSPAPQTQIKEDAERPPNPLLDVTKMRVPSVGRGALYPGSVFKGTQTSGRSAYEVEVRFQDVSIPDSTLCGYLSISHLTDAHPHLTTFFTADIIGPKHGFITGSRFGATEHDDMRHWGRFEQFRRPATRADMIRPELLFRDPLPDRSRGESRGKERDFVFLRIKERFLVPDHTVRDISGASFAGFYYALVDLSPSQASSEPPSTPTSPSVPKAPLSPTLSRRMSSTSDARSSSVRPEGRRRRESTSRLDEPREGRGEATIRGYYFHSLNQEPFQELFLTHVPTKSSSTFEMR
ncbi:vacuolar import and degradation protein-domain-containing protein [Naematelia encephala]|uniref:Vacuolar import and degradation protein-domain-containing protein n=1 Tax=Naematelia encephala TaxID=71784 RepID=A0A1Y2B4W7_9TREE|nr:vacuolar import and degradation protein-domain-containing protein [Naematelia encephala]